jgi:hypothetical protein
MLGYISGGWAEVVVLLGLAVIILACWLDQLYAEKREEHRSAVRRYLERHHDG